jgi:tryptophan halogenase
MPEHIKKIVILGGGTAGWMSAAYLAKALQGTVEITLVESRSISKIGVGEATVPNLQKVFFDFLGLKEMDWMPHCNAAFKTAVKFINWKTGGLNGKTDHFYHPFGILPECDGIPLSHYWLYQRKNHNLHDAFDYACFKEPAIMDAKLAPVWMNGQPAMRYAWHFDAHLVATFLCRFAVTQLHVKHIIGDFVEAKLNEKGFIANLKLQSGQVIDGDLFIDCSGFRGLLMNQTLNEPFLSMNDHLLCDSAIATSIPHDDKRYGIEPYTSAIAMQSGWTWKIPMLSRFGSGYVYSSQFISQDKAIDEFCRLWQLDANTVHLNKISFRVGRNRRAFVKNCVGIGLSSCFLEPLESTGIYFISAALYHLVKHFPNKDFHPKLIQNFNKEIESMFDDTRDFIQAHFYFSPRVDTEFWRANKSLYLTDNIREKIALYHAGLPINQPMTNEEHYYQSFDAEFRNFWTNGSYYCIFSGLGVLPENDYSLLYHRPSSVLSSKNIFSDIKNKQQFLRHSLPSNYEYLCHLHGINITNKEVLC